jgi:hypothetical protein
MSFWSKKPPPPPIDWHARAPSLPTGQLVVGVPLDFEDLGPTESVTRPAPIGNFPVEKITPSIRLSAQNALSW